MLAGDTLTSIATNMASAINADTALQATAVTATSSGTVLNIKSASANATTYTKSTSGGATETIAFAPSTSATQYGYNNLNEMTSIAAGGATNWQGTANKALKTATVNATSVQLKDTVTFSGNATLANGANTVPVSITDGTNGSKTNNYQVSTIGSASVSPTFDLNGNMTSDGTNIYVWDAENRMTQINYPGSGNSTQFLYFTPSDCVKITEYTAGIATAVTQFVTGTDKLESRDANGSVISRFFGAGFVSSGSSYFYTRDHLNSVREISTVGSILQATFSYEPYGSDGGQVGGVFSNFEFAGYFFHKRSNLYFTDTRAYDARFGRWTRRDKIAEAGGTNLFCYVVNAPCLYNDPSGLAFMGCRTLVNTALHLPDEAFPQDAPNTKCFFGIDSLSAAQEHQKKNCCPQGQHHRIWCMVGNLVGSPAPPDGPVPDPTNLFTRDGRYTYSAFYENRGWTGSLGDKPDTACFGKFPPPVESAKPYRMCCDSCVKD